MLEPADTGYQHERWSEHFVEIDKEIARLAPMCTVPLLDPGVIERVVRNDTLASVTQNRRAFDELRQLLTVHCSVRDRAVATLGPEETNQIMQDIVARLRARLGGRLGTLPPTRAGSRPAVPRFARQRPMRRWQSATMRCTKDRCRV